jgi:hypothetical protein
MSDLDAFMAQSRALIDEWEGYARRAFVNAERESDPMGKRLIEHGAMCYFNCAQELKKAVQAVSFLQPSAIQGQNQT